MAMVVWRPASRIAAALTHWIDHVAEKLRASFCPSRSDDPRKAVAITRDADTQPNEEWGQSITAFCHFLKER